MTGYRINLNPCDKCQGEGRIPYTVVVTKTIKGKKVTTTVIKTKKCTKCNGTGELLIPEIM